MNRRKVITRLTFIILAGILISFGAIIFKFSRKDPSESGRDIQNKKYHLQIVTEKNKDYFWSDFKRGVQKAADDLDVYVEFVESDTRTTEDIVSLVKRGTYADVDGIAFRPTDIRECSKAVELAKENGVSVITFESEENILPMTGSVNSDYFQIGKEQGKLLMEASGGSGGVVVIVNEKDMQDGESLCNAEKMHGIAENFEDDTDMQILDYYKVNPEMFRTEQVVMQMFQEHPNVRNIICTDASITQGVAEYIKEKNLEGKVHLIGYGNTLDTMDDMKEGIVYGTVYADAESIGYDTVKKLCSLLDGTGKEDIESVEAKVSRGE